MSARAREATQIWARLLKLSPESRGRRPQPKLQHCRPREPPALWAKTGVRLPSSAFPKASRSRQGLFQSRGSRAVHPAGRCSPALQNPFSSSPFSESLSIRLECHLTFPAMTFSDGILRDKLQRLGSLRLPSLFSLERFAAGGGLRDRGESTKSTPNDNGSLKAIWQTLTRVLKRVTSRDPG